MNLKQQLEQLLMEHSENCGDARGRTDGEYLSKAVTKALELVNQLPAPPPVREPCELPDSIINENQPRLGRSRLFVE